MFGKGGEAWETQKGDAETSRLNADFSAVLSHVAPDA